jgi:mannose-6-phosphate isomerase-like protein (cupin superfamily)
MKIHFGIALLFYGSITLVQSLLAQSSLPATDVTAATVQAFVKALPPGVVSDRPIRVVDVGGYRVGIYGVYRPKSSVQVATLHETKVTEVYQILEGAGTLVTGGTIVDGKKSTAALTSIGHTSVNGPRIEGGVSRRVSKGDMVIIPGGTPHWFSNLESDLTYVIMRPDPESTIPLK